MLSDGNETIRPVSETLDTTEGQHGPVVFPSIVRAARPRLTAFEPILQFGKLTLHRLQGYSALTLPLKPDHGDLRCGPTHILYV
jgi:hypothetical protein